MVLMLWIATLFARTLPFNASPRQFLEPAGPLSFRRIVFLKLVLATRPIPFRRSRGIQG